MIYSQDKKHEIAIELWPFLRRGQLDSGYAFSYTEDAEGDPGNPAVIRLDGSIVSPSNWDGDTSIMDGIIFAYRPGYISGSLAPNAGAMDRYFRREGEIKSASERYADERRRKALAKKIFFGVIAILLAGLGFFVYKKKYS